MVVVKREEGRPRPREGHPGRGEAVETGRRGAGAGRRRRPRRRVTDWSGAAGEAAVDEGVDAGEGSAGGEAVGETVRRRGQRRSC